MNRYTLLKPVFSPLFKYLVILLGIICFIIGYNFSIVLVVIGIAWIIIGIFFPILFRYLSISHEKSKVASISSSLDDVAKRFESHTPYTPSGSSSAKTEFNLDGSIKE